MGWNSLDEKWIKKSRKASECIWCGEAIEVGQPTFIQTGTMDGDFQSNRYHPECSDACGEFFANDYGDDFEPGANMRGSTKPKEGGE